MCHFWPLSQILDILGNLEILARMRLGKIARMVTLLLLMRVIMNLRLNKPR